MLGSPLLVPHIPYHHHRRRGLSPFQGGDREIRNGGGTPRGQRLLLWGHLLCILSTILHAFICFPILVLVIFFYYCIAVGQNTHSHSCYKEKSNAFESIHVKAFQQLQIQHLAHGEEKLQVLHSISNWSFCCHLWRHCLSIYFKSKLQWDQQACLSTKTGQADTEPRFFKILWLLSTIFSSAVGMVAIDQYIDLTTFSLSQEHLLLPNSHVWLMKIWHFKLSCFTFNVFSPYFPCPFWWGPKGGAEPIDWWKLDVLPPRNKRMCYGKAISVILLQGWAERIQ